MGIFTKLFMPVGLGGMGVGKNPFTSGGDGGLDLPSAPSWWEDPNLAWSQDALKGQSDYLLSGLTKEGGTLSGLMGDTVSLNPDITRLAMTRLQASMDPYMRDSRNNILNELEANNQLTGSTTASSLGNLEADYLSALTAAGAEASIADINRALTNRMSLYGTGLNTTQAVGTAALQNQQMRNNFAMGNYENQLAEVLGQQPASTGGIAGGLQGAIGGGIAGFTMGGPWGAAIGAGLGGYSGYTGAPGTGGSYLSSGALLSGLKNMSQLPQYRNTITSGGTQTSEQIVNNQYYTPFNYANSGSSLTWS